MDEIRSKLTALFEKESWTEAERRWVLEYLDGGDVSLLEEIARKQYEQDLAGGAEGLDRKLSRETLEQIHRRIGTRRRPVRRRRVLLAAAAVLLVIVALSVYRGGLMPARQAGALTETDRTAPGERKMVTLGDGSRVWLSPGSELEFPGRFDGTERMVKLEGEAFFDIAKDPVRPFRVVTGDVVTRILGTSFDVNAYRERNYVSVTVATGKVAVTGGAAATTLDPDEKVVFDRQSKQLTKVPFPHADEILKARRDGRLSYKGARLSEVVEDLEVQYGVKIRLDTRMTACTYYGEFDTRDDLRVSLKLLCLTLNARLTEQGGVYLIAGKGC